MKLKTFFIHSQSLRPRTLIKYIHCSSTHHSNQSIPQLLYWPGLPKWRAAPIDCRRSWGPKKQPIAPPENINTKDQKSYPPSPSLVDYGTRILSTPEPIDKLNLTHQAWRSFNSNAIPLCSSSSPTPLPTTNTLPARPPKPELVPPRQIPTLKQTTLPLNTYVLHNLTHVELNAIDLAWDTIVRFSPLCDVLPLQFYSDFARVADDESRHLSWCLQRLEEVGSFYGAMPAHNLLWDGCSSSANDIRDRLAVVPMSQEARGLDAGDRLAERLVGWGDNRSAAIVSRIAAEEKAHVAVGVVWFRALCAAEGVDPGECFVEALTRLCPDLLKAPFNHEARQEVGLERAWYDRVDTTINGDIISGGDGNKLSGNRMKMEELKIRLESMLATELQMCGVESSQI